MIRKVTHTLGLCVTAWRSWVRVGSTRRGLSNRSGQPLRRRITTARACVSFVLTCPSHERTVEPTHRRNIARPHAREDAPTQECDCARMHTEDAATWLRKAVVLKPCHSAPAGMRRKVPLGVKTVLWRYCAPMRTCARALMRGCTRASVRRCAGAPLRWCAGVLVCWCAGEQANRVR